MTSPRVQAVVPTYDNRNELDRCISSLLSQNVPLAQVLVCVDGSVDGTLELLARRSESDARIVILSHPDGANHGRAAARNLSLAQLDGDYTWFVDSDMDAANGALERHLSIASPGRVSVGQVEYVNADSSSWAGYLNTRGRHRYSQGARLPEAQFTTANALVATRLVRAEEGFDERFATYGGEDIDFAIRLSRNHGVEFVSNPAAVVETVERKTIDQAMRQFETFASTNLLLIRRLYPDWPMPFELCRLDSARPVDRVYRAALNPISDALSRIAVRIGPEVIRNPALSYQVVRAVWKGYLSEGGRAD